MGAERDRAAGFGRLEDGLLDASDWYLWGPYVSERQWGTVREDYSESGDAWDSFPHDHARSRAYRWSEDGMAGFCDIEQRLCLALALWNGRDPILKERMFGLTGTQGNHGEDVKEYWWYVDATPSHAWNRWRYHYPQGAFPYEELIEVNAQRDRTEPEYELLDTGAFADGRYWVVEVDYAKADPHDVLMAIRVTNAGPDADTLHVLPTVWFRNTWSWDPDTPRPELRVTGSDTIAIDHPRFGAMVLEVGAGPDGPPELVVCENETNVARLYGAPPTTPYPKDGINDHVVSGAETVNPDRVGTKAAAWYRLDVQPGETVELRARLRPVATTSSSKPLGRKFVQMMAQRRAEADELYAELAPAGCTPDEALVMRQALAGMLWGKQLYAYDVARWLEGDPTEPTPPASRWHGRNARWQHFQAFDIMSMPDPWEYPWFAAWDMAFHCVALAHVDPAFAKYQLVLLCREWFQHPNGALPAYEWDFGDVNPPVQAWAALEVFVIDGARDVDFLSRVFDKLLVNFTWWVNREDADGSNLFEGGFLGLDNIGPIDRSHLPVGGRLEQSDATGWMGFFALGMAAMSAILRQAGRPTSDLTLKFLEHFAAISRAIDDQGVWDDEDHLFYDKLTTPSGQVVPVEVRSMVGIIPALAAGVITEDLVDRALTLNKGFAQRVARGEGPASDLLTAGEHGVLLLSMIGPERFRELCTKLFDESEFLSPYGLRAVSAYHRDHPYVLEVEGITATIDYEPAESTTSMFGGNSNWRGPIWMPLNYLVVRALDRYGEFYGEDLTIEYPTGSGTKLTLHQIADDLRRRLVSLFTVGPDGRRPCYGWVEPFLRDPRWQDLVQFNEYFHGDNGAGLGASHQTGWTGIIADVIRRRGERRTLLDLIRSGPAAAPAREDARP